MRSDAKKEFGRLILRSNEGTRILRQAESNLLFLFGNRPSYFLRKLT